MPTMTLPHNPTPVFLLALLIALGLLVPPIVQADIYSWTDADGVRHFSNKPPPGNVAAFQYDKEIPYDRVEDRQNQADDERYFDRQAKENTSRRSEQAERALAESQYRTQTVERWPDKMILVDDDYDDTGYGDGSYGDGGYYDGGNDGRRDRGAKDRRKGRQGDRAKKRQRDHSEGGGEIDNSLPEWKIKQNRIRRSRRSKRERGVSSGITRVVRAVPSPYYMGYRPVYNNSDASYRSGRGSNGSRRGRRGGGGSRRSGGGRGRVSF